MGTIVDLLVVVAVVDDVVFFEALANERGQSDAQQGSTRRWFESSSIVCAWFILRRNYFLFRLNS